MFASQRQQGFIAGVVKHLHCRDLGRARGALLIQKGLECQFGIAWAGHKDLRGLIQGACDTPEELTILRRIAASLQPPWR